LDSIASIYDTLCGRRGPTNPVVQLQRNVILGPDNEATKYLIDTIRHQLTIAVFATYEKMKALERSTDSDFSFFKDNGLCPETFNFVLQCLRELFPNLVTIF
jgi:hypothetical protein